MYISILFIYLYLAILLAKDLVFAHLNYVSIQRWRLPSRLASVNYVC